MVQLIGNKCYTFSASNAQQHQLYSRYMPRVYTECILKRLYIFLQAYCDQPLFVTFAPRTEENQLLDNVCYTYFPLPDDPNTYQLYISRV